MPKRGLEEANVIYKSSIQSVEMKWREVEMKNLTTIPTVKHKAGSQCFAAGLGDSCLLSNIDNIRILSENISNYY